MKDNDVDYIIYLLRKFTKSDSPKTKEEMDEQDAAGGDTTGGGGGGKTGYPSVTKWSSKRKFGPTYNPEQKKWTSGMTRGPSNTLL